MSSTKSKVATAVQLERKPVVQFVLGLAASATVFVLQQTDLLQRIPAADRPFALVLTAPVVGAIGGFAAKHTRRTDLDAAEAEVIADLGLRPALFPTSPPDAVMGATVAVDSPA